MERRLLSEDDRALLRSLLSERLERGVEQAGSGDAPWAPEQCLRLLKKIEGPDKTLVVESMRHEVDEAERRAEESGCG
jgi:hypothetical protein